MPELSKIFTKNHFKKITLKVSYGYGSDLKLDAYPNSILDSDSLPKKIIVEDSLFDIGSDSISEFLKINLISPGTLIFRWI